MLEGQEFKVSLIRAPGDLGSKNLRSKNRSGVRHSKSSTEGKMMGSGDRHWLGYLSSQICLPPSVCGSPCGFGSGYSR